MTEDDKIRLFDICRRSKRGLAVTEEEHQWASDIFDEYPDDYEKISKAGYMVITGGGGGVMEAGNRGTLPGGRGDERPETLSHAPQFPPP